LASYTSIRDTAPKTGVAVLGYSDTEVESIEIQSDRHERHHECKEATAGKGDPAALDLLSSFTVIRE